MFCTQCQRDVAKCTCPDIDARLEALSKNEGWAMDRCGICGRFSSRCLCGVATGAIRAKKCKQCGRLFVNSDAHDFYQFCSDLCQQKWWDLLEIAAELVRNSLDQPAPFCS